MLFTSTVFCVFFALFFLAYWGMAKHLRLQNALILAASYLFYGWWDERFLILVALSTACDYICGLGVGGYRPTKSHLQRAGGFLVFTACIATALTITSSWPYLPGTLIAVGAGYTLIKILEGLTNEARRKAYLFTSVALNLGLLAVFKYFNFFAESFIHGFGALGLQVNAPLIHIILPVGISFYTFQTMSYTIDIYRKNMEPTNRFIDFAAYVAFFPQLVAGPIERARHLLPQFETKRRFNVDKVGSGVTLFVWGLYKKVAIADNLAPIANAAFADPAAATPSMMLLGIVAFAFQIYCDFSGYTDMARGLARMIGFDLSLNFNLPYLSRTPSEFWRRWHISLSSWLRDYLYISLGGNRGSKWLTYRNLIVTMVIGGLWHGAAWTFVAWGAFHGGILALYRIMNIDQLVFAKSIRSPAGAIIHLTAWTVMFLLTLIGWTFFRAETIGDAVMALSVASQAFTSGAVITTLPGLEQTQMLLFFLWPLLLVQTLQVISGKLELLTLPKLAAWPTQPVLLFFKFNVFLFVCCGALFLAAEAGQEFIYFDF